MPESKKVDDRKSVQPDRAIWERPHLKRLATRSAEIGEGPTFDGNGTS